MSKDYKFAFKHSCIEECPSNSKPRDESIEKSNSILSIENYFCRPICNEIFPFELIMNKNV